MKNKLIKSFQGKFDFTQPIFITTLIVFNFKLKDIEDFKGYLALLRFFLVLALFSTIILYETIYEYTGLRDEIE